MKPTQDVGENIVRDDANFNRSLAVRVRHVTELVSGVLGMLLLIRTCLET